MSKSLSSFSSIFVCASVRVMASRSMLYPKEDNSSSSAGVLAVTWAAVGRSL